MLAVVCSVRRPLSVPKPTAASATFCVYGSSRIRRTLSHHSGQYLTLDKEVAKAQWSTSMRAFCSRTFSYGFSLWYEQPSYVRFQTISHIRRNSSAQRPEDLLGPW